MFLEKDYPLKAKNIKAILGLSFLCKDYKSCLHGNLKILSVFIKSL